MERLLLCLFQLLTRQRRLKKMRQFFVKCWPYINKI